MTTAMTTHRRLSLRCPVWWAMGIAAVGMTDCDQGDIPTPGTNQSAPTKPSKPAQVLSFPESLHVADESVNAFVEEAMAVCAAGDYNDFRLLWSKRQEPIPQSEFDAGWKAVLAINVRALERIRLAVPSEGGKEELQDRYVFLAEVHFDPQHRAGRKQPTRQVVLLIGKEEDHWHLAPAPAKLREWVRDRVAQKPHPVESAAPSFGEPPSPHH